MKRLMSLTTILIWLAAGLISEATAQNEMSASLSDSEEAALEKKERDSNDSENAVILIPEVDPYLLTRSANVLPDRLMQTGGFVNTLGAGVQYTLRPSNSRFFGQWFATGFTNPTDRISNSNAAVWTGATFGIETLLTTIGGPHRGHEVLRTDADGVQIYARVGPGIGLMGVGVADQSSFNTHFGIHTAGTIGGMTRLFQSSGSFYVEGTVFVGYFPGLQELRTVAGPQLTIGFTIFNSRPDTYHRN